MATKVRGLGKGLSAIFMENEIDLKENGEISTIRISDIEPNKKQPRFVFDENALSELADSISSKGILQPLLVRPIEEGRYQIIAGERRWRASRMVGLTEVPVIIKEMEDSEAMEIALIENLQREDLTPTEEANGYKTLMEKYELTQEEVAKVVGKSRSAVTNTLRLLGLPKEVLNCIDKGKITAGHARAMLSLKGEEEIKDLLKRILDENLSVRQVEQIIKNSSKPKKVKKDIVVQRDAVYDEIELSLREYLGRRVKIKEEKNNRTGKKCGTLQIEFFNEEDLMNLLEYFNK